MALTAAEKRRNWTPYLLLAPMLLWLLMFFLAPMVTLLMGSLQSGSFTEGFNFTFEVSNYVNAIVAYWPWFLRSIGYALVATLCALLIAYPLAYMIVFKAGRWKYILLVLVVAPLFASFLVRTLAWTTILADEGVVVGTLRSLHILSPDQWLLATPVSVIAGLTYNFLPFMTLPIYVSLDRIDKRLIEAATDLYASGFRAFRRVTLPLSLPGIVSGMLLVFIPAAGDFVNAQLLGSVETQMIGNVIESQYLRALDYPMASALSVILIVLIIGLVTFSMRRSRADELL
ncbi:ABC transporter permease [Homoserinimonas sp. OAct 916]|uniref:ABC transporter permease n=1 Tax=Homoserinimonas sp. OAct 916 TaxID=2211450 RepID=UPI000DBE2CD8|nr:ABC transporter permease [Homoserinimonas sp. OAct 916]